MSQLLRFAFVTVPASAIHVASYPAVLAAAFFTVGANGVENSQPGGRYLLEWTPLEGIIPYTATAWGLTANALAVIGYISKPLNWERNDDGFAISTLTMLVMLLTVYVFMPAIIVFSIMSSPVLLLFVFANGWEILLAIVAILILIGQNFINIPFSALDDL